MYGHTHNAIRSGSGRSLLYVHTHCVSGDECQATRRRAELVVVYIVMAYIVMAYIVVAYTVMTFIGIGLHSCGLYRSGLHSQGPYSHGYRWNMVGHPSCRRNLAITI